jgi:hypothetical protein
MQQPRCRRKPKPTRAKGIQNTTPAVRQPLHAMHTMAQSSASSSLLEQAARTIPTLQNSKAQLVVCLLLWLFQQQTQQHSKQGTVDPIRSN